MTPQKLTPRGQLALPLRDGSLLQEIPDLSGQPKSMASFMAIIQRLKLTPRTGWVNYGVPLPESISDHMYRMAIISMLSSDSSLDRDKCMRMALVHDMAEALVGDITPLHKIQQKDKHEREMIALTEMTKLLPAELSEQGKALFDLFLEYELGESPEAIFVKEVDKYELMLQTLEYERQHEDLGSLEEFLTPIEFFRHPLVRQWAQELLDERASYWKERMGAVE